MTPRRLFAWLRRDLRAAFSLAFLLALALLALCAPLIAPYPVTAQDVDNTLASPSALHLLGTDDLGREVTLTGIILHVDVRKVGDYDYRFPVVDIEFMTLWPERIDRVYYDYYGMYPPYYWHYPYYGPYDWRYPYRRF